MNVPEQHCAAIAVLGTASDVGKSIVATALCRIFRNAGVDVVPYKAQNMSNNSGVTPDGLEIGRAQVVQAEAAGVVPTADMNPVLLKPNTDTGAQVVLQGRVASTQSAKGYFKDTSRWAAVAFESLHRLMEKHELLVIEGAGSCAEMNLYERDFVNFRTAREAGASVVLVADIDRGGVFAQVVGTLSVIPPEDRALVKGVIINRFRGDIDLFRDGVAMLERMTGVPVLGVIPYFRGFTIDAEDAVPLAAKVDPSGEPAPGKVGVAAIYFPHISNFTDLSPLEDDPLVDLHYLHRCRSLTGYRMLVLPGSKNVRGDLDWLRRMGWEEEIRKFRESGGLIIGICGGFQMLGEGIVDPHGLEGEPGKSSALGLLPVTTELEQEKYLSNSVGWSVEGGVPASGYEIHMGRTEVSGACSPFLYVTERNGLAVKGTDGVVSADERVIGTYFHGIFDEPELRGVLLQRADLEYIPREGATNRRMELDGRYNMLAEHFSLHLDLEKVFELAGQPLPEVKR